MIDFESFLQNVKIDKDRTESMKQARKIIAFSPHPDDMEIAAGGYIAEAAKKGAEIKLIVVSDGRMGSKSLNKTEVVEIRRKEQIEAAKSMRIKHLKFFEFQDTQVPEAAKLRDVVMEEIREFAPDLVVTIDPYLPYESHPDHINTGLAVLQSVLFHNLPSIGKGKVKSLAPAIALAVTSRPNVIINIDDSIEDKLNAIKAHKSQFPDESAIEMIRAVSSLIGKSINCNHAEPFRVLFQPETHMNIFGGSA